MYTYICEGCYQTARTKVEELTPAMHKDDKITVAENMALNSGLVMKAHLCQSTNCDCACNAREVNWLLDIRKELEVLI